MNNKWNIVEGQILSMGQKSAWEIVIEQVTYPARLCVKVRVFTQVLNSTWRNPLFWISDQIH